MLLSRIRLFITGIIFFLATVFASAQTQISLYVDSSQAISGAGNSWATAYKSLGEALSVANANVTTDYYHIHVAKGTYYPTGSQSSTNRDSSFLVRRGIRLLGGYNTGGTLRNVDVYPAILSGNIGSISDSADNSYHVVVAVGTSNGAIFDSVVLEGFSVVRGAATGTGSTIIAPYTLPANVGGGLAVISTFYMVIRDCKFSNNASFNQGGGIYASSNNLSIDGSTFSGNKATTAGGGIFSTNYLTATNSTFTSNTAGQGGAIFQNDAAIGYLRNIVFTGNKATVSSGGAIAMPNASSTWLNAPRLFDSLTFIENAAITTGGAVDAANFQAWAANFLRIRASTFAGNTAGSGGGAIRYSGTGNFTLDTCTFTANKTQTGSGGAVLVASYSTLRNVTFTADSATASGGGALWVGNNSTMIGCTFNANYCSGNGGAIESNANAGANQILKDCNFEGNKAGGNGGALHMYALSLERCRLRGNQAVSGNGGGVSIMGGNFIAGNSLFSGNRAAVNGGAIALTGGFAHAQIVSCTMAGDSAALAPAVYCSGSMNASVTGCIIWETPNSALYLGAFGYGELNNSIIRGSVSYGIHNNNTLADPEFVAPLTNSMAPTTGGNYALTVCSPAINTGATSFWVPGSTTDLAGNPRVMDMVIDKGAFEFQGTAPTPVAVITGDSVLCTGSTDTLFNAVPGGVWTSLNPSIATISPSTGIVTAIATGSTVISYTHGTTGCPVATKTKTITVLPAPPSVAPVTGANTICMGGVLPLGNATPGGTWTTTSGGLKSTVNNAGLVTPVSAGADTVRYTLTNGICTAVVFKIITINAPVVAPITGTTNACVGSATQLSNTLSGGTWTNFNTLFGTVSSSGIYTPLTLGMDTVYYQYTSNGCPAQVKKEILVNGPPTVSSVAGSASLCAGQAAPFTNNTAGGTWSSANATTATVSPAGGVTGVAPGTATINYTVTSLAGCSTVVSKSVTVNALPTVSAINGATTLCTNTTNLYTNNTAGGIWSTRSNGSICTISTTGALTAIAAGTDTVLYTVTNSLGCSSVAQYPVTINAPQLTPIVGSANACTGSAVQFSHAVTGGTWSNFTTAFGAISSTGIYSSTAAGTDTVYYQYLSNGCPAQAKKVLTIVAPDTAILSGNAFMCKGQFQTLTPSIVGGTWLSSNNAVANVNAGGQVSGISSGTVVITYTLTSPPGCTTSSTYLITVSAPVTTTTQSGATLVATGNQVTATYQWVRCDSNSQPIAGATNAAYTALSNGQYAVIVTYAGCADTSICLNVVSLGVALTPEKNLKVWTVFPNPTTSKVTVRSNGAVATSITLLDVTGRRLAEVHLTGTETHFSLENRTPGLYLLQVCDTWGQCTVFPITLVQ